MMLASTSKNILWRTRVRTHQLASCCGRHWTVHDLQTRTLLTVGIARETYDIWERRAPLSPEQVKQLLFDCNAQQDDQGQPVRRLEVLVQPSAQRIFHNGAYQEAGATLTQDLSAAHVILGVKRPKDPATMLQPNTTYMFFSHTIKGQPQNMEILQECLRKKVQLMDYERMLQYNKPTATVVVAKDSGDDKITSDCSNKRLVAFGRFAGLAGTMDAFHALGRRLLHRDGASTPFLSCPPAYMNDNLVQAKYRVVEMGNRIQTEGMDLSGPLVIAVTGSGGCVHGGVMELLSLLPHEIVKVQDLPLLFSNHKAAVKKRQQQDPQRKIYIVPVAMEDVFEKSAAKKNRVHAPDGDATFDKTHFRNHPGDYRSLFASRVAPYAHCIINAIYWDARFPRLLTKEQTRKLFERGDDRLLLLADISCDVNGSIEFLERTTTLERPFFQYNPIVEREVAPDIGDSGITVMGVDILPTELPRESSEHFGNTLSKVLKDILVAKELQKPSTPGLDVDLLNPGLASSCITTAQGQLAPQYRYLRPLLDKASSSTNARGAPESMSLSLEGHLFDSGLINQIADVVESYACGMNFRDCVFPAHDVSHRTKSSVVLVVSGPSKPVLNEVEGKIMLLAELITKADAVVERIDRHNDRGGGGMVKVASTNKEKRVLVLGAGRVSKTCMDRLGKSGDVRITVVSDSDENAAEVATDREKTQVVTFDISENLHRLSNLVEESDLVVSLLPTPLHPLAANECLVHRKHLVTASYESDEMRSLGERAHDMGVIFLNEVGLDPGLDHMSAMKIIDDIKSRGGQITVFSSFCGGLPAPEAADNPFKYKFSWSPMGVIRASQADARYRLAGREFQIAGKELLQSALSFHYAWPEMDLEYLPNRDSLHYEKIYGIEGAETMFRGTLRYKGFSSLMNVFKNMGMFEMHNTNAETWGELIHELRQHLGGFENVHDYIAACSDDVEEAAARATEALEWLNLLGGQRVSNPLVAVAFCDALQEQLRFSKGERDMVIMHHTIEATFLDSFVERHHADLQVFGDASASAMAKTVGYTTAAAAELILDGTLTGRRGLLLPTDPGIYKAVLDKVAGEGITFEEGVMINPLHSPLQKIGYE